MNRLVTYGTALVFTGISYYAYQVGALVLWSEAKPNKKFEINSKTLTALLGLSIGPMSLLSVIISELAKDNKYLIATGVPLSLFAGGFIYNGIVHKGQENK